MNEQGYTYNRYVNRSQETRWATTEEIRCAGTYVNTADKTYPVAGLPIMSDGREVYVDGQDHHTIIFGATGSKKTRLFCMPMLNLFAGAGESFITTDPKGELYAKTSGFVKSKGYKIVVLNFRNVGTGDMWNPLHLPYTLYKEGKKEEATSLLNDFTWDIFCDWYIELSKAKLNDRENPANKITQNVIGYVLIGTLKLLHPFIPFITEEIYLSLPHSDESIMISKYPEYDSAIDFSSEAVKLDKIIDVTKSIRARRSEMNVAPSRKAKLFIATKYNDIFNEESAVFFTRLASASEVIISENFDSDERISLDEAVQVITDTATVYIPLSDIIDFEKEKERLNGERKKLLGEIERLEKKLSNEGFVAKAPAAVIDGEKAKLAKYRENLAGVDAAIEKLH